MCIKYHFKFTILIAAIAFFSMSLSCTAWAADDDDIVIIVSQNAPEKDLSMEKIQNIYIGKITLWSSNEKIIVAVLKNDEIHQAFLRKYVKRNPTQFQNTWRQLMFTGKASKPKTFDTISELIDFIASNWLAIGYMKKTAADDKIKIIATE